MSRYKGSTMERIDLNGQWQVTGNGNASLMAGSGCIHTRFLAIDALPELWWG